MLDFIYSIVICGLLSYLFVIVSNKIPDYFYKNREMKKEKLKIINLTIIIGIFIMILLYKYPGSYSLLYLYLSFDLVDLLMIAIINTCLFSYVILYQIIEDDCQDIKRKLKNITRYYYFKMLVLAPIFEELYFRLLFRLVNNFVADSKYPYLFIVISSLMFALAHPAESLKERLALIVMTSVFGFYANYVFLRTNNLLCCVFLHFYCNLMGPPYLPNQLMDKQTKKILYFLLFSGIASFLLLISRL